MKAKTLSAETLLDLYYATDAFRRESRFQQLLVACEMIALTNQVSFDSEWLLAGAQVAKSISIQQVMDQISELPSQNADIGLAIKIKRLEAITAWLNDQQSRVP